MLPHLTPIGAVKMTPEEHRQRAIESGLDLGPIETRGFPWAPRTDRSGEVHGRLTVIAPIRQPNRLRWLVLCECGRYRHHNWDNIGRGRVASCGCYQSECRSTGKKRKDHGMYLTRTYRIWGCMNGRCSSKSHNSYDDYGGRGIKVCDRWRSFKSFYADMGEAPDGYSIERIDVNGDYKPENCKWIPLNEQQNNKRNTVLREAFGELKSIRDWSRDGRCVVSMEIVSRRIYRGWSVERSMTTPLMKEFSHSASTY